MKIENWPIEKLIPYARNPRKNDGAVDRMAAAIREFGFRVPIVAKSDGTIIDGHLRLKAAHKLGLTTVPVLLADDMTDVQVRAFRILVNRSATWAEWDEELLVIELTDLEQEEYPLDLTGMGADEIDKLLRAKPIDFESCDSALGGAEGDNNAEMRCPKCGCVFSVAGAS